MQAVWVKRITPRAWNMFRIALLHESMSRIVQKTTSYSRKEKTLTTHRALSVPTASHSLMIRCSSGRVTATSWNIFDTSESATNEGAVEHAGKIGTEVRQK